jgi:S-layer protein
LNDYATLAGTSNPYAAAATAWNSSVDNAIVYAGNNAANAAPGTAGSNVFTLTTGSDTGAAFTGTAGNDTYVADVKMAADGVTLVDTLQGIDNLNGGAGTDTLNATLNTAGLVTPTLTAIENVNVRVTTATGGLDLVAATGVTSVTVNNSTAAANVQNTGAAALGVANQNTAVTFGGSTATALTLNLDTIGTAATDIAVNIGTTAANAATSFVINAKDAHVTFAETAAGAATTSASVAATGVNEITFASADLLTLATLTVTGAGSADFTGAAMTAVKTLTAADGGVKVNATGGVLETATTGAGKDTITVVGANVKNISTGAGNDTVNAVTSALAATSVVDLGAGDDTLTIAGVAFAKNVTLTAGEGTDTLGIAKSLYTSTVAGYTTAELSKVTGFEVLSISEALVDADTIDVSKIAGVTSFKAAAGISTSNTQSSASAINLGANSTVELAGAAANNGTLIVSLKTDTSADVMTLILNKDYTDNNDTAINALASSHAFVAADVETLNVNSTGKMAAIGTKVEGYKADLVTNTLVLTGSNKLASVVVTGDQAFTLASTAAMTKLASVDGSANTGGVSFEGFLADMTTPTTSVAMTIKGSTTAANTLTGTGHADTITGGAKADVITGGKGGDTVTGNGGNDKFVFVSGDSAIGTGTFDTISDFGANTWGNGTAGAAGTKADLTVAAKVTGDVLRFTVSGSATASNGIKVFVATSAADATTFLANTASADHTQASAALNSTDGKLYVDMTGDGATDFYIALTGVSSLTAAAFDIV